MAQQPDISAILAALSAQKPAGTPQNPGQAPTQPPSLPPGFPGQPLTPGALAATGLSLPPPSSSGALDLSSIKPSSSGSVNFADAIAKAQGAAQRTRDQYADTRSRSRSPSRRDNFRDNYNPYRDDRRSDSRRDNRDRSRSPVHNRRDNNDNDSEIITMDSGSVGLVIGRGGENLRRVEQDTGARVQFITGPDGNQPRRQCRISGTARQRSDAKREIFRTIDENPNGRQSSHSNVNTQPLPQRNSANSNNQPALREGENSMQILVPDRTVGLIIGRGGETIRDLQDRSGCHINIVGENKSINGMRPVNLIGTQTASDKARAMIDEIVDSDTRGQGLPGQQQQQQQQPQQRRPQPMGMSGNDPYGGQDMYGRGSGMGGSAMMGGQPAGGDKINDVITVPSDAVGMIIGKGGETIKNMQTDTGCKINVSPPSGADLQREIGLIGSRSAIDSAKQAIWDKVNAVRDKQGQRREPQPGSYGGGGHDPYSQQQQQPAYGQAPAHANPPVAAPPAGEASASDPYAAYGGYQNYVAMWYAAMANQQGQGGAQPPAH